MQDAISNFKNRLFLFSFGLGLASTVAVFQLNTNIKEVGKFALGFSVAGVVLGEFMTGKAISEANQFNQKNDAVLKSKQAEISTLVKQFDVLKNSLETATANARRLQQELVKGQNLLELKTQDLATVSQEITQLKIKLVDVGKFSKSEAYQIVRKTYTRAVKKLEGLLDALIRNYPDVRLEINPIYVEVDSFQSRYLQKLSEYESCENFEELLDIGLELQEKIIDKCVELKIKAQTIVIRYLETICNESIPYQDYEAHLNDLAAKAGQQIQQNQRAIALEWVAANEQHVQNYETEFTEILTTGKYAATRLLEMEKQLEAMQSELVELRKPLRFTGTIDYALAGNSIIEFYHKAYRYTLDAIAWQETDTGYILTFATARNKIYLTADMLHSKDNREQLAGLTNALSLPTFTPNYQSGLMVLDVVTRKPVKKKASSEADISRLWVPATNFETTVKKWSRVRITGGSESGKSPTAENLAVCILKNRPGTAKLFNPQHDSAKNYWTIPVVGTSHKESEKAIALLAKQVDARSNGQESRDGFELSIFDEIDSTMSHTKGKKSAIGSDINFIIKQASHQNLGAIFIGQNANVSEYPGMDRSDWNNAINLHIGANAYDAITNSNRFTNDEQVKLKETTDKLMDYCAAKNEELGLDKTDPTAYRFALVIEPNKKGYFIELPVFGQYTFDQVAQVSSDILLTSATADIAPAKHPKPAERTSNTDSSVASGMASSGYVGYKCPKCENGVFKAVKKNRGVNYYICGSCLKQTSENVLNWLRLLETS